MSGLAAKKSHDVIIIGAGAAGLACARELLNAGKNILILEGRNRIGGRIFSKNLADFDVPVELGAEFVHGTPACVFDRLESLGLSFYDIYDTHLSRVSSKLKPADNFWDKLEKVTSGLDPNRKIDRSFKNYLDAHSTKFDAETRALAVAFVEGFHAADTSLIGERGLADAEQVSEDLNDAKTFRLVKGYSNFLNGFLHGSEGNRHVLRLNTIAKRIVWKKKSISVHALSTTGVSLPVLHAQAAVITLPLGVLKAPPSSHAALRFEPEPKGLQAALLGAHMGHAMRIVFRFRTRFWEQEIDKPLGFLHTGPDHDFPTWWTHMPVRAPLLTAWQGGPRAQILSSLSLNDRIKTALESLAFLLGLKLDFIYDQVLDWHSHDWTADPFALGAYSYVAVDGMKQIKHLSQPIEDTLFFSGEATHTGASRGTVDGAIETGLRAAKQVLKALR